MGAVTLDDYSRKSDDLNERLSAEFVACHIRQSMASDDPERRRELDRVATAAFERLWWVRECRERQARGEWKRG